jgi:hypothetical protein
MEPCAEPVLLIAFNRPDLLAEVIGRVRPARPPRVYLAVDGARPDRPGEAERVLACREMVSLLDWGCEVHTLFRERNLGCGRGVSGAITWFFENEERGVILEDDIVVDPSFFDFAADLLERYQDDDRVVAITGTNFVPPEFMADPSGYRFSRVPVVWGWATWRSTWDRYRFDIDGWRSQLPTRRAWPAMGGTVGSYLFWSANFDLMARHAIDTWDLQLVFASMAASGWTATPPVNLVDNVGFRSDATHTLRTPGYLRAVEPITLPLADRPVVLDESADRWLMRHVYGATLPGLAMQAGRGLRRAVRRP